MKNCISTKMKGLFRRYARISFLIVLILYGLMGKSFANQWLAKAKKNLSLNDITISVHFDDTPLDQAVIEVGKKAGIYFRYNASLFNPDLRTSYEGKNMKPRAILKAILPSDITFESFQDGLFFHQNKDDTQDFPVSGSVLDEETQNPLPGVNIAVKGTMAGTSSDLRGHYSLSVPSANDTLMFSFIGYKTQEIPIKGRTTINVTLQTKTLSGKELVVVGYGVQRKSDLTGSISSVNQEDFNQGITTNPEELIQGKAAGVQITQRSGDPNTSTVVSIRGVGSLRAGTSPLYVVDGIPLSGNADFLDSQDINSIDVLKDASSQTGYLEQNKGY